MKRRHMLKTGLALGALPTVSWAQTPNWPQRPVRVIVPFAAGSFTETAARAIGQELSNTLGQPFVIDTKGGAGSTLGSDLVAKSTPDGYTLMVAADSLLTINPHVYPKLSYDPLKDFMPVTLVASNQFVLSVNPKVPATTLPQFVAYAKQQKQPLSFNLYNMVADFL